MTGWRPRLVTHDIPAYSGEWMGIATFSIPYADGREPLTVFNQLVPGYAVRPRRSSTVF
ncbi:hypothetical protein [Nocardia thraciensis]